MTTQDPHTVGGEIDLRSYWDAGADPSSILQLGQQCPTPFSKDLQNRDADNVPKSWIKRIAHTDGRCAKTACQWRDNIDSLHLTALGHWEVDPADDPKDPSFPQPKCDASSDLDGTITIPRLVTRLIHHTPPFKNRTEEERGLHAGHFTWTSLNGGIVIQGYVQGLTNLGTVRSWTNVFEEIKAAGGVTDAVAKKIQHRIVQRCNAQGFLEGRLFGRVTSPGRHTGARIVGIYRWYTDPSYYAAPSASAQMTGLIEGLMLSPC